MCSIVKLLIIAWARFGYEMIDSQWGMKFQVDYNPVISNKHRYGIALEVIVVQARPPQQGGIPRVVISGLFLFAGVRNECETRISEQNWHRL